ncbi:glycoside hydrolase family 2 protein [Peribacillus frigoritolerans]|uniref:Glycoside hydrolase family 2 TIM barrel-domain containing protein n=1 Tax=Peribacillus frigoritolerans TaxID=450367 RepID=A0AAJ1QPS2_9BACI|nr:sugar-binding domain-containing protein [Peribacillus frigoritolerans]MDM5285530.1 glycoside hydrolase family 2 TIM barrel-domain containing protein [Peribacillus frigoritolerans]
MPIPRNEYPRPQFVRKEWENLNGQWDFAFDDENKGLSEKWFEQFPSGQTITVPFAFQTEMSGINDPAFHDVVWYHRRIMIPEKWSGKQIQLHFGAVDYRSWVYVNGNLAYHHEGGHTPFSVNITHLLNNDGREDEVTVRVEDPSEDVTIPRGKQYWHEKSESIFYTRTTGIWQTVWMEPCEQTSLSAIRWTPEIDRGDIDLEFEIEGGLPEGVSLSVDISFKGKKLISDSSNLFETYNKRSYNLRNRFTDRSNIHGPGYYWSPEHPHLFEATLTLKNGEQILDQVETYFGMRKVSIENGIFMLNNMPYYQKLILDQGYFPKALITAPSDEALKRDIELAKEMGFNGARKHQKVEDPRFLYWADKLGFLVWGEMANASEYSEEAARRLATEWFDVVKRDYSHPSIIVWLPLNESWGISRVAYDKQQQAHATSMYWQTKSIDQSRPVLSNDGWEHTISDICGIHNYRSAEEMSNAYKDVDSAISTTPANRVIYAQGYSYGGEPILITEYGGIAYKMDETEGWGYSAVQSSEDLVEEYRKVTDALFNSPVIQGFCYTQLTDVEQEINGLLTYDREPKCDLSKIREINNKK